MSKKAKSEKKDSPVGTGSVRQQHPPFYNVVAGGQTVEWTDKLSEASTAFKDAGTYPKFMYRINGADVACLHATY